jgi:hypothetical protein
MKTLILALVACLMAMFFACQENAINQPETTQIHKDNLPMTNSIKVCCEVRDPNYGVCNMNGCIDYTLEIIRETMSPRAGNSVYVKLYMNAILCDKLGMVHLEWRVEDRSVDVVYVSEEGIAFLDKCYNITNRNDVDLLVRFLVTTNGIGISEMILAPIEKTAQINYKEE